MKREKLQSVSEKNLWEAKSFTPVLMVIKKIGFSFNRQRQEM